MNADFFLVLTLLRERFSCQDFQIILPCFFLFRMLLILKLLSDTSTIGPKMPGFFDLVKNAWNIDVRGTPLYRVVRKLRLVKLQLIEWKNAQSSLSTRILEATIHLEDIQNSLVGDPNNVDLQEKERTARYHVDHVLKVEESMYK